mmetsp:Transcript_28466/g.56928  ORF Transcript_28466/g.56928 Transcript_28466/m.56928 type:complete len:234 (+) Transcript_28466:21-722(+)
MSGLSEDERNELDLLRIENEALRANMARLSSRLDALQSNSPSSSPTKQHREEAEESMAQLRGMMVDIQMAKQEAMRHSREDASREQLIDDIHYLHSLLVKAKDERLSLSSNIDELRDTVRRQKGAHDKLQERRKQDKVIFVELLKRERMNFEERLEESDRKVLWFEQEMRKVAAWARERQKEYNAAVAAMAKSVVEAKSETLAQANSYNLDLSAELESLRYEASELLKGKAAS